MARSISVAPPASMGRTSTLTDAAADWIAHNMPTCAIELGLRVTANRVMRGAISLSSSSHFALMPYSNSAPGHIAARVR
jgi:hypothetical protein